MSSGRSSVQRTKGQQVKFCLFTKKKKKKDFRPKYTLDQITNVSEMLKKFQMNEVRYAPKSLDP